jgi:PAS domain-containing protein
MSEVLDENILAELDELVFITDKNSNILAVNDAVEETLLKPREELLHRPLFSVLFLRDKDGRVINKDTLELDRIINGKVSRTLDNLSLLATSSVTNKKVSMRIKPLAGMNGIDDQISFILSAPSHSAVTIHKNLEVAMTRHTAMIEGLKKQLRALHLPTLYTFLVIAKTEQDIPGFSVP